MNRREFLTFGALGVISTLEASTKLFPDPICLFPKDIYLSYGDINILKNIQIKLKSVQSYVGYGHYNYISFDEVLFHARNVSSIGVFSKIELEMMDRLFYDDVSQYGFYGAKTTNKITSKIDPKELEKIPRSGHYIFKGKPLDDYKRLEKDVGSEMVLTSGVRGVPKQMYLYITKILNLNGNISKASKIIAPPAYTYHAISDFDVGKRGFGVDNFSERFTTTNEYKELIKLDYISIRYKKNNKDGVRYEPWHIEVI